MVTWKPGKHLSGGCRTARSGSIDENAIPTAFSRLDPQHKVYVQDKIYEHKDEVWQLLQDGVIVYICGDTVHMVPAVDKTFVRIYQEKTGKSEPEAKQWLDDLKAKNVYMVDIWGR